MKARKKPVEVDFVPNVPGNEDTVRAFLGASLSGEANTPGEGISFYIYTKEGVMKASPGDMIIRGVQGEPYPCKPDIFAESYEVL